jgi:hypothetical protein
MTTDSKAPPSPEEAAKVKADAAAKEAAAQAKEAYTKLKLFKVTSTEKRRIDTSNPAWSSLVEGANHFEGDVPEDAAKAYAKLIADGAIQVECLDGSGKSHTWTPPELPADDGKQH